MIFGPSFYDICTVRALLVVREGVSDPMGRFSELNEKTQSLADQCIDFIERWEGDKISQWDLAKTGFPFFHNALLSGEFGEFEKVYKAPGLKEDRKEYKYETDDGWYYKGLKVCQAIRRFQKGRYIFQVVGHACGVINGKICCDPDRLEGKETSRKPLLAVYRYIGGRNGRKNAETEVLPFVAEGLA